MQFRQSTGLVDGAEQASKKARTNSAPRRAAGAQRVRVAIADDDPLIRDQIGRLLERRFEVVARAANGRILMDEVRKSLPAVAVTDITMPEMNGIEAARQITKTCPGVKVIVVSVHDDLAYVDAAFDAGASGYVLKLGASRELIPAIEEVLAGRSYRSPRLD